MLVLPRRYALLDEPSAGMYGLQLSEASGVKAGGMYPVLARLEDAGWVSSWWEQIDESTEGRRRRRYYRLTTDGASMAYRRLTDAVTALAPPRWSPA